MELATVAAGTALSRHIEGWDDEQEIGHVLQEVQGGSTLQALPEAPRLTLSPWERHPAARAAVRSEVAAGGTLPRCALTLIEEQMHA